MPEKLSYRPAAAFAFVLLMLLIPTVRLASIMSGDRYREAAAKQSLYTLTLAEERGSIYDRNGVPLTGQSVSYVGAAAPSVSPGTLAASLAEVAVDGEDAREKASRGVPFLFEAAKAIQCNTVVSVAVRQRYGGLAPHLIGYPTTETESGYTGLEAAFSGLLDRYRGAFRVTYTVNAAGQALAGVDPVIEDTLSLSDGGLVLTLDTALQAFVQEQFDGLCGAAVVLSKEGDILALVSTPTFDANDLSAALTQDGSPLLDRTLSAYDVGSVFKTVVAAAALEIGISPERTYVCEGSIDINGVRIRCHDHGGHGELDLKGALVHSCNPYFIDLAREVGAEKILAMAQSLNFGQTLTLADGVCSKPGNLPNEADLRVPAALANLAIGQGTLLATPLQVAAAIHSIASGGEYVVPRLVLGETDGHGSFVPFPDERERRRVMSEKTAKTVLAAMRAVFEEGSLAPYDPAGKAAGKTSTAQTGMVAEDGHGVCQAWLAGIYPAEEPEYTLVLFVEDGASGTDTCGPLFQQICNYLERNESK